MIILDTSVLVDALSGQRSATALRAAIDRGERLLVPALVLYEWLRGPRTDEELDAQEALFPSSTALPFGPHEAAVAARLYATVARARGRELDLAIAAHALAREAALWSLNVDDFADLPGILLEAQYGDF